MAAPPYMKLYVADYLADTTHLRRGEHGAYLLLLMAMWRAGGKLPATDAKLAQIAKCSPKEWADIRETVLAFFTRRGGQLTHKRLAAEMAKAETVSSLRKDASEKGVAKRRNKNSEEASANGAPNADHLVPYIKHQTLEEKPPKPPEGAFFGSTFEKAWKAYPESGRATSNRAKAGEAWVAAANEPGLDGARLLAAVQAYAEHLAAQGAKAKSPPAFHRWLAGRRFEAFLREGAEVLTRWNGPDEVWAAVVVARGEPFAISWLADCAWQDAPVKAVLAAGRHTFSRLVQDIGPLLAEQGVQILERAA